MYLMRALSRGFLVLFFLAAGVSGGFGQDSTATTSKEPVVPQIGTRVVIKTNLGSITVGLYDDLTPKTVENFVGLVKKGYYDSVIFHRIIKGFMMQGGDPTGTGAGGRSLWGAPFEDEIVEDLHFDGRGILAMANSGPKTNGSQFFITFGPAPWLDTHHTIFGEVVDGMDVLDKIEAAPVGPGDKPVDEIVMTKVEVLSGTED